VLGGPAAAQSAFLPQPLEGELAAVLGERAGALAKLYPGDELDSATLAISRDARATYRGFTDAQRAAYALTLAGESPSYTQLTLPGDAEFDWPRALKKCAANYTARRVRMGLSIAMDVYFAAGDLLFRLGLDSDEAGMVAAEGARDRLTYSLDQRLLFALITGLLSWNAMEASALIAVRRTPDVYTHDLHRSIVHFTLLS
jgi:hypothetical protein